MALHLRTGLSDVINPANISLLIPAYNTAETVAEVVRRCRQVMPTSPIVVVDDGSTDTTATVAENNSCEVLSHNRNQGKGAALKSGFAYLLQRRCDAVITLDADLQHPPESIPKFMAAFASGRHDLLLGARTISAPVMPFHRVVSNTVTSWMISRLINQRISDSQCGYRLIACRVLRALPLKTDGYELESELLIEAGRRGFRIGMIPIETIYGGNRSHIRHLPDIWRFIKLISRSL